MRFVFGFAGIPANIYDAVYSDRGKICGDGAEFVSEPLVLYGKPAYRNGHIDFFLRDFAKRIREDNHNHLQDTAFAIIYVNYEGPSTAALLTAFFPFVLCIGVNWQPGYGTDTEIAIAKNALVDDLKAAAALCRKALPLLKREVQERDNRTPLLLPAKNFKSDVLTDQLAAIQAGVQDTANMDEVIRVAIDEIQKSHRLEQRYREGKRPTPYRLYIDKGALEFHMPGRARHAFARGDLSHPDKCVISGRVRLGAPYDRAFHYDCQRMGSDKIRESLHGCHTDPANHEGSPHINIAPNDFVRA